MQFCLVQMIIMIQKTHTFYPLWLRKYIWLVKKGKNKIVKLWGTGKPKREILHVDEVASACEFFLRKKIKKTIINIGSPIEMTIKNYARLIRKKIDPKVLIRFNNDKKLDGVMRKKLNLSLANSYGWKSKMNFITAIEEVIEDYKNTHG